MDVTLADAVRGEIRAEIARRGLTQAVIVRAWGGSRARTSAKLTGRVPMTGDDVDRAARALGFDPFEFVARAQRNARRG